MSFVNNFKPVNIILIGLVICAVFAGESVIADNMAMEDSKTEVAESAVIEKSDSDVTDNAESPVIEEAEKNPCISTKPELGDSAFWAITAIEQFADKQYENAVNTVNTCFSQWGPDAGQQQKMYHDEGKKCPPTGKVGAKSKGKIEKNYLMNDVSTALWAKARSLHMLGKTEQAKQAYSQCMYMTCGRTWDPNGWYWSPAKDCAKQVQSIM
ncbi:MAG: hypothetical protein KJO88_03580 [Gammaproteobacteria bacterium]|nr:hypothetical protein [Gammaproteobacteria bacterium]